jgi:hypothetical protein
LSLSGQHWGGRLKHPSSLTPPAIPDQPPVAPEKVKSAGLKALLDGEAPEAAGQRIEEALKRHFGPTIEFAN